MSEDDCKRLLEKPREVEKVFIDFFGEEFVDLQVLDSFGRCVNLLDIEEEPVRICILVRFPEVTVTNEYESSTTIKELYAKIPVAPNGTFNDNTFYFCRGEYTYVQWCRGYIHSHAQSAEQDHPGKFKHCCLGRGPIRGTVGYLASDYDLDRWQMFCLELSRYVEVESVEGVPYNSIKDLSIPFTGRREIYFGFTSVIENNFKNSVLIPFMKWVINNKGQFKINFNGYGYDLAYSYYDFRVMISNYFIEWYNQNPYTSYQELLNSNTLVKCKVVGRSFTEIGNADTPAILKSGVDLFEFKGDWVTLKIEEPICDSEDGYCHFLSNDIISFLYVRLLKIINYDYRNKTSQFIGTKQASRIF